MRGPHERAAIKVNWGPLLFRLDGRRLRRGLTIHLITYAILPTHSTAMKRAVRLGVELDGVLLLPNGCEEGSRVMKVNSNGAQFRTDEPHGPQPRHSGPCLRPSAYCLQGGTVPAGVKCIRR
jgi:hypothetical protein